MSEAGPVSLSGLFSFNDNTEISGSYALMKTTKKGVTASAKLISPLIDQFKPSPNCRLTLKYNLYAPSYRECVIHYEAYFW